MIYDILFGPMVLKEEDVEGQPDIRIHPMESMNIPRAVLVNMASSCRDIFVEDSCRLVGINFFIIVNG